MGAPYSSSFGGPPRAVEFGFMPNPTLKVPSGLHTLACDQRDSLLIDDGVLNRLEHRHMFLSDDGQRIIAIVNIRVLERDGFQLAVVGLAHHIRVSEP